jgi:hypothetical protein
MKMKLSDVMFLEKVVSEKCDLYKFAKRFFLVPNFPVTMVLESNSHIAWE